jgi:TolB-like protein/DNA-binding SARP family transcriptional activator/Flp pilus assembly protein TadD
MSSSPTFYLRLFGSPSIEREGGLPLTGRVAQRHRLALLALIAMAPVDRLSRDKLIAYLWPESDTERGRNLLKVSTYVLRTTLGEGAVLSEGDDLRLNADVVRVDATEFEAALTSSDHARAVALYTGPFLDGFFLSDAPEFEQWVGRERERLSVGYAKALEALADEAEAGRDFSTAAQWWKARAAQDLYDSRVAARLMQALEASGNPAAALQHAAIHQRLLQEEFGIAPSPEIAALADRLRREPVSGGTASSPGESLPPSPPASLPESVPVSPTHQSLAAIGEREVRREPGRIVRWAGLLALAAAVLVMAALWRFWPVDAQPERSIAVLPFVNLSGDPDREYFTDGLTEEIIAGLSAVPELKVISRTSAMHYKGSDKPLREIARELKVAHILEGSVRQNGTRFRITAQLIDARVDGHRWAQTYDSDVPDIIRVQEKIAREVVRALAIELGERGQTALVNQGTSDVEAYELYQRGRYLWNTRSREGHERAVDYYRRAIERDSSFADAYAGLADAYMTAYQLNLSSLPEADIESRHKWAAERALALNEKSADAHRSFAVSLQWQRNWPGAEREFRRAIQLDPGNATAHSWYGLLLAGLGRLPEALEASRRADELDPFAVVVSSNYGWQCYLTRDYDCGIAQQRRTLEISPNWARGYNRLGLAYAQKGMLDEAVSAERKAVELGPERPDFLADLAFVQALRGDTEAALESLRRAKAQPFEAFNIARAYAGLRQPDSAFAWLERSHWQFPHRAVRSDPGLDSLRSDARFARLSERIDQAMGVR